MFLIAILIPAALLVAMTRWVRGVRPRPLSLAGPIALGLLISAETLLLRALSLVHQVAPLPLVLSHLVLLGVVLASRPSRRGRVSHFPRLPAQLRSWSMVLPVVLLVLVLLSAVRYAPNNLDALNYHLTRVAFWMEHRSIALYETPTLQQNVHAAGAEYLLLILQSISNSDRLSGLLQLACGVLVACAAPALARLGGAPVRLARWAWVFPITMPMAILQATTAQNDLVAAALAVACIAALLPFLHRGEHRTPSWSDAAIAGLVLGAAVTTKLTAAMAALPFLVFAGAIQLARLRQSRAKIRLATLSRALLACAAGLLLVGVEADRARAQATFVSYVKLFSYVGLSDLGDRPLNSLRGLFREIPAPGRISQALHLNGCPDTGICQLLLRPHEDVAGQPLHAAAMLLMLLLLAVRWRHIPVRTRAFVLCLALGWIAFHATFRENPWIARLHLPLFAIAPLGFGVLHGLWVRRWIRVLVSSVAAVAAADGVFVALENERRPPLGPVPSYVATYYWDPNMAVKRPGHERALAAAAASGCRHLDIELQPPGIEYPLIWRAMRAGIDVRHVDVRYSDAQGCLVYRDPLSEVPPKDVWVPLETEPADALVYRRR